MPSLILRLEPLEADDAAAAPPRPAPLHSVVDVAAHERRTATPLGRWRDAVGASEDGCLVLDPNGCIVGISASGADLLGCADSAVGRPLLDVVDLVDLETGEPDPEYAGRITPLAVVRGGGLMRSLLRVRHHDDSTLSIDTASAAVHDAAGAVVGSISFLSPVAALQPS